MNKLHMLYKSETGQKPIKAEITFESFRDLMIIDYADVSLKKAIECKNCVEVHDEDYIIWLENKLIETLNL